MYAVDLKLIEEAARQVRPHVRKTPLLRSDWLSEAAGAEVWLKCENLQVTGSFKVRGALAAASVARGPLVAASAGNHGLGLAYAAKILNLPCTVFVPRTCPNVKADAIRKLGAKLVVAPFDSYDDTQAWARSRTDTGTWVSPFDDPRVIAGNGGTTALEIFEQAFDTVVVPCGGGGLAIGAGIVAAAHKARVIGVNSDASPGMWLSRRDGRAYERIESLPTIAEGLEGGVSENTYRLGLETVEDIVVVSEASLAKSVREILRRERMVVEGSAAAGVAAILEGKVCGSRIAVVLTGSNIDPDRLRQAL